MYRKVTKSFMNVLLVCSQKKKLPTHLNVADSVKQNYC